MSEIAGSTGLDAEIKAFEVRQSSLEKHHHGKWVVFHGGEMIDAFDTFDSAASEAVRRFGRGPYLIRQVGAPKFTLPASVMYRQVLANAAG